MQFRCHGVRGSVPVPLSLEEKISIYTRISRMLQFAGMQNCIFNEETFKDYLTQKISDKDLHLLFGTGGNTPCVELFDTLVSNSRILFDLGTGVSKVQRIKSNDVFHIFLTHFHYDHIQGLPVTQWLYDKNITVHFYSPVEGFENILKDHMKHPYFPVTMDFMTRNMHFHDLTQKDHITIEGHRITWKKLNHPGGSYAYKVEGDLKSFCYVTDVDIRGDLFENTELNKAFLENVDSMIIDASMGFIDSIEKRDWGHTSLFKGLSFCKTWNVKKVYLFHCDPSNIVKSTSFDYQIALWYNKVIGSKTEVFFAQEDVDVVI